MNIKKCPKCNTDLKVEFIAEDDIELSILNDGYIPNNNIWRRWVMAQMLRHYKDLATGQNNFDKYFVQNKPYSYSWTVAINEMKAISHMSDEDVVKRTRFFNRTVIYKMLQDYRTDLEKHLKLKFKNDRSRYIQDMNGQSVKIIKLPYFDTLIAENGEFSRDTSVLTVSELFEKIDKNIRILQMPVNTPKVFAERLQTFTKHFPMHVKLKKSAAWKNAFKGAGAYYTMDNMIKFHGCTFKKDDGTDYSMFESLKILDERTAEYKGSYYKLFALMKQFIEDNNYDIDTLRKELSATN